MFWKLVISALVLPISIGISSTTAQASTNQKDSFLNETYSNTSQNLEIAPESSQLIATYHKQCSYGHRNHHGGHYKRHGGHQKRHGGYYKRHGGHHKNNYGGYYKKHGGHGGHHNNNYGGYGHGGHHNNH